MITAPEPLLSFVMTGRDDDYMPDFKYRLTTTLESLCRNAAALGRLHDIEIVFVDWGSPTPLVETLSLSPDVCASTRFVYVPKDIAHGVQGGRWSFHSTVSVNAGIRRARGRYVLIGGADQFLSQMALDATLAVLGGRLGGLVDPQYAFFMIPRRHVPWSLVKQQPSIAEWNRFALFSAPSLDPAWNLTSVGSGTGGIMMSRDRWFAARGLDESMGGYGFNDLEIGLRATRDVPWIDLSSVGANFLHFEHPPNCGRDQVLENMSNRNVEQYRIDAVVNDANWGLADAVLESRRPIPSGTTVDAEVAVEKTGSAANGEAGLLPVNQDFASKVRARVMRAGVWTVDGADLDALAFLAIHSRQRAPLTFVEIGASEGETAFIVADASPAVEAYLLDTWDGHSFRRAPSLIAEELKYGVKHQGYVRFVNANPAEGLRSLSAAGRPSRIDLAFLRLSRIGRELTQVLEAIGQALARDGAIVVAGTPPRVEWDAFVEALGAGSQLQLFTCERHATTYLRRRPRPAGNRGAVVMSCRCPTGGMTELRDLFDRTPTIRTRLRRRARNLTRRVWPSASHF